jgi:hypothetical protein
MCSACAALAQWTVYNAGPPWERTCAVYAMYVRRRTLMYADAQKDAVEFEIRVPNCGAPAQCKDYAQNLQTNVKDVWIYFE